MARIAVTGATGFIGTSLVQRLRAEGHQLTVLLHSREPSPETFGGLRQVHVDVTRPETLRGKFDNCDLVFHLAGCTIARSRADFMRVNRDGTENVARACAAAATPPRLQFVSSLAAVGPAVDGIPLAENAPPAPVSDYGRSKLAAERVLESLSEVLPIQIVRPPSVMGESDPYMLGLFQTAKARWVFLPGAATHRYSLIHVDDLVAAMLSISQREEVRLCPGTVSATVEQPAVGRSDAAANPGLVHLAQHPPMTFVQTAQAVSDYFGRGPVRKVRVPKGLCWLLAGANSMAANMSRFRPLLNLDKMREGMAGEWIADSTRLTGELGFEFPLSLEERIRQTAESYHAKGWI